MIKHRLKRFCQDESGQSLVFAALTFFAVMIVALMVMGVGEATSTQMELQNAADAGAYSGAEVLADCVSQIAWLNEAMANVYYHNMRYAVDVATTAVHAEFKEHAFYYGDAALFPDSPFPSDTVVGLKSRSGGYLNATTQYNNAYARASKWIPKGEDWLQRLSRIQRGLAILTPKLVEHQAMYTVLSNLGSLGGEIADKRKPQAALWPSFIFVPNDPARKIAFIERLQNGGWYIWSDTNPFEFTAEHISANNPDRWQIEKIQGSSEMLIDVKSYPDPNNPARTYKVTFAGSLNGDAFDYIILIDPNGTVHVLANGDNTSVSVDETKDPVEYTITQGGTSTKLRRNSQGYTEYYDSKSSSWIALGGDTTTVDGVDIPVDHNPNIEIGDGAYLRLGPPIRIDFPGLEVVLSEPIYIRFSSPFGWINVNDERAAIRGLNTKNPSDVFRVIDDSAGQTRHRLREIVPVVYNPVSGQYTGGEWEYEWQYFGSYANDMSMRFFSLHSIMDNDPDYAANNPGNAHYFAPTKKWDNSNGNSDDELWQTSPQNSRWRYLPRWAQPPRDNTTVPNAAYGMGGWFSIEQGKPVNTTAYSQSRKCWYCVDKGDYPGSLKDYDDDPFLESPTYGETCLRPCGFWYEKFVDIGSQKSSDLAQTRVDELNTAWVNEGFPGRAAFVISALSGGNKTVIQVTCPVCVRKYSWNYEILKSVDEIYPPDLGIDLNNPAELAGKPSIVRKYLAHALGRKNSVKRALNLFSRQINPNDSSSVRDFFALKVASYDTAAWLPPLQLTSEFFRKGITVAAWRESVESDFFSRLGGKNSSQQKKRLGILNPVEASDWGHFGIATARLSFWDYENLDYEVANSHRITRFEWSKNTKVAEGTRPDWISQTNQEIDIFERPIHWQREKWIRSQFNLFEPDWGAKLVSNRQALDVHDLYSVADFQAGIVDQDNGATYLLRHLQEAKWGDEINDLYRTWEGWDPAGYWRNMTAPPLQKNSNAVNFEDPKIEDLIRH